MNALGTTAAPMGAEPVVAAIERHQQAFDGFMDVWGRTHGGLALYDRAKVDEAAAAEL